ncbi:SNF2 family N-terminal domain-containing protein [Melampsora americana]|nr:SNF2 family N-terminal domain-containing protein [Melampsora americana]
MSSSNTPVARRSDRIRTVTSNTVSTPKQSRKAPKRKRSDDDDDGPSNEKRQKKPSNNHHEVSARSAALEAAQRAFIKKHRALFLELLPESHHPLLIKQTDAVKLPPVGLESLPQPTTVQGKMKSYQLSGLSFLVYMHRNGINGILGDEMGLGKTLQTLSLLAYLKEQASSDDPQASHLIICPLSVLSSWQNEIKKWTSLTCCTIHGSPAERTRLTKQLGGTGHQFDIVLTTYEAYEAEQGWYKYPARAWGYVVLDEGHRIKNWETQLAQSLQPLRSSHRLILTGTPVQNNLVELWSLLHWLLPHIFTPTTLSGFSKAFDLSAGSYNTAFLNSSRRLLSLLMLRRTKDSVQSQLSVPPREEITLYLPMSPCQRFWTKRLIMKSDMASLNQIFQTPAGHNNPVNTSNSITNTDGTTTPLSLDKVATHVKEVKEISKQISYAIESEAKDTSDSYKRLMNLLIQLRKVCDHPYLMPNSEPEPFEIAEHVVEASNKLILLDKLLTSLIPQGKRILIFSGFTRMLDILEDFLNLRSIGFLRLDGGTSRPRRSLNIRLFQNSFQGQSPKPVFLISTSAGGLGINLTAADTVVLYDSSWNPQVDIQAIARAHRIGQTRPVTVYRLICAASVEEQMLSRLRKKLYLSLKIMEANHGDQEQERAETIETEEKMKMSRGELCAILRGGARVFDNATSVQTSSDPTDDEDLEDIRSGYRGFIDSSFEEILEKARQEEQEAKLKLEKSVNGEKSVEDEKEELELLQGIEVVRTRMFEGKKYLATRSQKQIGEDWVNLQRNARVRNLRTQMIDGHAVENDTLGNVRWEAVKTITSDLNALSKLQNTKRTRRKFDHEEVCIVCHDGGELYLCNHCPRVGHAKCLGWSNKKLNQSLTFTCTQHACISCSRSTNDSGGMLYRCQTCSDAYCEDCLPEEDFHPIGDIIPEFILLGYGPISSAYYIRCVECIKHFKANPETLEMWEAEDAKILRQLKEAGIPFRL